MVGVIGRRAEHRDDGIADIFVDVAAMALDDVGHSREIFVHQRRQTVRRDLLGDLRKALEVGEEHRHLARLAAELGQLVRAQHAIDHVGREIKPKTLLQQPPVLVGDDQAIADREHERAEPCKERLDDRDHRAVFECDDGVDEADDREHEECRRRAHGCKQQRGRRGERRNQRRDRKRRVLAEFDRRVVADQIVDGGGLDIDAGDGRAPEPRRDQLLLACATRRSRTFKACCKAL